MKFDKEKVLKLSKSIRLNSLEMTRLGNSSHIGSVLSIADILAVLYESIMNYRPKDPNWSGRDRFILSKGHAGAGVYSVLAEKGFFSKDLLKGHCKNGSNFSGHVSHKGIPGVEFSTGSLGHGLGVSCGIAYSALKDKKNFRVFTLLSDGECDEGSNWESILFAAHHKLNNLCVIVDYNKLQSLETVELTLGLEPFEEKWKSFGWDVLKVNGHSHQEIYKALKVKKNKPFCLIADTVKGKGVSFMENQVLWHYRSPQEKEYESALKEIIDA
jgi:transketolase